MAHQYDYDAATVLGFLRQYGLQDEFALNLEANHGTLAGHTGEHETAMAAAFGKLGSIDANRNEAVLGGARHLRDKTAANEREQSRE